MHIYIRSYAYSVLHISYLFDILGGDLSDKISLPQEYQISSLYEAPNGLILCPNCHIKYDSYIIGITPSGYIEENTNGSWKINQSKRIFKSEDILCNKMYPSEKNISYNGSTTILSYSSPLILYI